MAWLSEQRQRLPPELRRPHSRQGMHGLWAALPAVHVAQLFLRVTSDVVILNSACGEPLALAGAWQWFDGPTFMSMLDELPTGGQIDWSALLRESRALPRLRIRVPEPSGLLNPCRRLAPRDTPPRDS